MSDAASRAVFLSYARDDAAAARRIAEALRGFGLEVWFDQSELRGGDAWDAKIRGQIKTCTLFMPIVSARTEERSEGYFRREWKLAVDRTHDMGAGRTFILPVVIDDIKETAADVPEEFMRYQWTRLPGGEATPEFVAQVKKLLEPKKPSLKPDLPRPPTMPPEFRVAAKLQAAEAAAAARKSGLPGWIWGAMAAVVFGAAAVFFALRKPAPVAEPPAPVAVVPALSAPPSTPAPVAAPVADAKSIAVLPFENMSVDKDNNAFFADGVHEDILTNLAYIRDLHVVSRTSVEQYRGTTKPISEIARELHVAYVLEGSVRRAGNKVRVTGQLIKAATDEHVWAKAYDRDVTDVFAIQGELASAIAAALQSVIAPETKALLERRPTDIPAAYDAFLQARQIYDSGATIDFKNLLGLLHRAVELDPKFAGAWADLGAREAFIYFKTEQTPEQLARAQAAIDRAVQLAPDDPVVVEGLGDFYYYAHRDYVRATEQYLKLAQLRPNDATVYGSLARIQRRQGRLAEALPNFQRSAELDPQSLIYATDYIGVLFTGRRYAEAEAVCRRVLQAHPQMVTQRQTLAQITFAGRQSDEEIKNFAALDVPGADRPELIFCQLQNARMTANWAEAIRLDRAQRYYDGDNDVPFFLQDVLAAATFAEAGDAAASRARAGEALALMNGLLVQQPLNAQLWSALSLCHGLLGHHDDAIRCGAKARELLPESRDALNGAWVSCLCASALAYVGEKDRALAEIERLVHVPYGFDPVLDRGISTGSWKPLRDDPRFQAVINDPKNNQPLF